MLNLSELHSARWGLLAGLFLCVGIGQTVAADQPVGPLSPEQALKSFQLAPGLRIELVAAEPLVVDPVAIAFDEDGRLWVVEMRDYPNGPEPGEAPLSRVRVLEDRDGDGRFDHSRIFADRLLFANGVLPWQGGVFVTASGAILYLKDTDGDGRADRRETWFTGFAEENPQLRVNHPTLGIDHWVYAANGLRGGTAVRADDPDAEPVSLSGMDFRFDPRSRSYEAVSGMGQFGLTFDDWGNRFVCSNRNHLRHMVLADRYIKRNPYLAVPDTAEDIPEHGAAAQVFPLSRNWTTSTLHTGTFTAACGVTVYRGDLLPEEFAGNSFTCEPTGNLVHRDVIEPAGATFLARRGREGVEFLASPDEWFRPVNLANGPDGALYVIDMYRAVIEHPQFMPPELKNRPDLRDGADRGRIWRIVPAEDQTPKGGRRVACPRLRGHATPRNLRSLHDASTTELVGLLAHPNGWWRDTAQRLLIERGDPEAVDSLRFLLASAQDPRARLHAAWTLEGLGALDEHLRLRLLYDEHPRLREHAVRLSEPLLGQSQTCRARILELADDPDPRVRFQVALSLGDLQGDEVLGALASIACRDAADRWTRLGVASAVPERAGALLHETLGRRSPTVETPPEAFQALTGELCTIVGSRRDPDEVTAVLSEIVRLGSDTGDSSDANLSFEWAALNGLSDGIGRRGGRLADLLRMASPPGASIAPGVNAAFERASELAGDSDAPLIERSTAVRLLAHAPDSIGTEALARLVHGTNEPPGLRTAAVRALAGRRDADVSEALLQGWKTYSPAVRRAVADAMTRSPERITALFDAMESGAVSPSELGPSQMQRLRRDRLPEAIRQRADRLIARSLPEDRSRAIEKYRPALDLAPDVAHGRAIFEKTCSTCHRVAGIGVDVGPDIADTRTRTPESLLVDILNPNRAIDADYVSYTVVTQSGQVLTGIIASETASSVTLRHAENETDVVLRQDIDEMHSNGISLMPEGVEKDLTIQDVADLIGFLKNWRYEEEGLGIRD